MRTKKLVLFFTTGMSLRKWGEAGIIKREVKLYNELARDFDKIYFMTYGDKRELEYKHLLADNIEVLYDRFGLGTVLYSLLAPILHRKALEDADYFKTNQLNGSHTAVIAKVLFKKKLVVRQGYPWLKTLREKNANVIKIIIASISEKLAYKYADEIIVTTAQDRHEIILKYGMGCEISVIPNYVDTELFKPTEHPPEFQKTKKRLAYIGRLAPEKNLINLIDAVKDLDAELFIIGGGSFGIKLKQKIDAECIRNVYFMGRLDNELLPAILQTSDIYVQVSTYEGSPKTILEAMSCGLPVVGTNVRGIRDIIKDGENGYLCNTSADSIKETIRKVIDNGAAEVSTHARDYVLANFTLEKIMEKEREIYAQNGN